MMNAQRAREQRLFQRGWNVRIAEGWALQLHFARRARDSTEFTGLDTQFPQGTLSRAKVCGDGREVLYCDARTSCFHLPGKE